MAGCNDPTCRRLHGLSQLSSASLARFSPTRSGQDFDPGRIRTNGVIL
jgi:hypothetical protein